MHSHVRRDAGGVSQDIARAIASARRAERERPAALSRRAAAIVQSFRCSPRH